MNILRIFDDHHVWHKNDFIMSEPHCVKDFLWTSSIVKQLDFVTHDIFIVIWLESSILSLVVSVFSEF